MCLIGGLYFESEPHLVVGFIWSQLIGFIMSFGIVVHHWLFFPTLIGPSYSHMKANLPYSDLDLKVTRTRDSGPSARTGGHGTGNVSSTIPSTTTTTTGTTMPASNDKYPPSLPNVGNYQAPSPGNQYGQPTYPGQKQYQERGEVYPQPNERSKLLNP